MIRVESVEVYDGISLLRGAPKDSDGGKEVVIVFSEGEIGGIYVIDNPETGHAQLKDYLADAYQPVYVYTRLSRVPSR